MEVSAERTEGRHPMIGRKAASRNGRWAAAGVGMVALGALLGVWGTAAAGDRGQVALAAHDVPAGAVIGEEDLRLVEAAGLPEGEFPGTGHEELVGKRAAIALKEGTPIPRAAVADSDTWPSLGRAVVAAALAPSAVPEAAGMGAPVDIVLTGQTAEAATGDDDEDEGEADGVVEGRVHSVERSASGEEALVHLQVPEQDAAALARAAAAEEVRLVLTAAQTGGAKGEDL